LVIAQWQPLAIDHNMIMMHAGLIIGEETDGANIEFASPTHSLCSFSVRAGDGCLDGTTTSAKRNS
jgi:hypothetical protein